VLGAIAVAAQDWRATLGHLTAIVTFLIGVVLSMLIARPLKAWPSWPLLPTILGIEVILIVAASLAMASGVAYGAEVFVMFVSLALGLQNGAFRRVGGITVHTTYLTGMITSLVSTETEKYAFEVLPPPVIATDPKIGLRCKIWFAFVSGALTGATLVLHFRALGMLGVALLLVTCTIPRLPRFGARALSSRVENPGRWVKFKISQWNRSGGNNLESCGDCQTR